MNTTRVVLSFDDGRKDNYIAATEILQKSNLPATFNITSGYIEKTIPLDNLCPNEPMSLEEVINLSKVPIFEIAGHGYAHLNTIEDWDKGIKKLTEWLSPGYFEHGYGIASPHSGVTDSWVSCNIGSTYKSDIKYIRTGLKNQSAITQRGVSKIARMTGSRMLMYAPIKESVLPIESNKLLCYSVPVLNPHTYEQIRYIIDKTVQKKGDIILMLHSILKKGESYYDDLYSWDYDKFAKLCEYLCEMRSKGIIDVKRNIDIVK